MQTSMTRLAAHRGNLDYALGPLRAKFAGDLMGQAESIDALMLVIETAPDQSWPMQRLLEITHRLAGVAAILGFQQVGALAQRCELAIAAWIALPAPDGLTGIGILLDELVLEMERQPAAGPAVAAPPRNV